MADDFYCFEAICVFWLRLLFIFVILVLALIGYRSPWFSKESIINPCKECS